MSTNTILASAPLTSTGYHLKANGTTLGNSLIWDNGTNVGIGNTNTSYTLDVSGTGRFTSAALNTIQLTNTGVAHGMTGWAPTNTVGSLGSYDAAGNFAIIGFSSTAGQSGLSLFGFIGVTDPTDSVAAILLNAGKKSGTGQAALGASETTFQLVNGGIGSQITVLGSGNVGIGTSSPSYQFDVYAASGYAARLNGATYGGLILANGGTANSYIVGESTLLSIEHTTAINLRTNNADRIRITSAGNVGIGTTSPQAISGYGGLTLNGTDGSFSYYRVNGTNVGRFLGDGANFYMDNLSTTGSLIFTVNNTSIQAMRITSGGKVMVNTTDSGVNALLYASASSSEPYPLGSRAMTSSQGLVGFFDSANGLQGSISISGSTVSYNSFLGSHWSQLSDNSKPEILIGTILEAIDELCEWDNVTDERLPKVKISDIIESKNIYGVFSNWDNTDDYNDMYVAAVGAGFIRINSMSIVSMGDLLQSNGDGTAKVQSDDIMRSSTIAKVTSTQKITTYEDGSYLIAATLHCG